MHPDPRVKCMAFHVSVFNMVLVPILFLHRARCACAAHEPQDKGAAQIIVEEQLPDPEVTQDVVSLIKSNVKASEAHLLLRHSKSLLATEAVTRIGRPYPLRSPIARKIEAIQSNCSLPIRELPLKHSNWVTGLGADIHIWSQLTCLAIHNGERVVATAPWAWLDYRCNADLPLGCYFLKFATPLCVEKTETALSMESTSSRQKKASSILDISKECKDMNRQNASSVRLFRDATTEYLFSGGLSKLVLDEIRAQMGKVFGAQRAPRHLITVHIRWGDKAVEMELATITEYVEAVHRILDRRKALQQLTYEPVHVFVSSEDPRALGSFQRAAPDDWNIYGDAMVDEMKPFRPRDNGLFGGPVVAQKLSHIEGTCSLASLAIAMEANEFVLVLGSNWSRLMDELRRAVIDPACGGCTFAVNLRQGQW